jgi:hypothetical protein
MASFRSHERILTPRPFEPITDECGPRSSRRDFLMVDTADVAMHASACFIEHPLESDDLRQRSSVVGDDR